MRLQLRINSQEREVDVPLGTSLLSVLRDDLGLTGSRYGCGLGWCGACYVLADGGATPACMMPVEDAVGREIVSIEGLAKNGGLHPLQSAFLEEDAMQCGYCISGMLISGAALLARIPHPGDAEIRDALAPHLCRCGVYGRAIQAVKRAAGKVLP